MPLQDWQHPTHFTPLLPCSAGCPAFITNDTDFRRVDGLPVIVLNDLVDAEEEE